MLTNVSVAAGFVDFAAVEADIHAQLFSATGLQDPPSVRADNATKLATRLHHIQSACKVSLTIISKPLTDMLYQTILENGEYDIVSRAPAILLDIMMYCLLTIVYRVLPSDDPGTHPLQCNNKCIEAARQGLSALVEFGEPRAQRADVGWQHFLNT